MRKRIRAFVFAVLRASRVSKLLHLILVDYRQSTHLSRVTSAEGTLLGEFAVVHNSKTQRDRIRIGKHSHIDGELLVHDYGGRIEIGEYSFVGLGSRVWSGESVKIGDHVFIAHNVNITDTNSHQFDARERMEHYIRTAVNHLPFQKGSIRTVPVVIENHAWINFGVGILKGVRIGEGAIVGANSLVTKDVPPYTLVAGNPARVIRKLKGNLP